MQDSKQLYRQAPLSFEERSDRLARELAAQVSERRRETREVEERVEEALVAFREGVHGQLGALDQEAERRFEELRASCELLRGEIGREGEGRRRAEGAIMEQLRETVAEIKQLLTAERGERERNRDKLCALLANAKEMIARG